MNIKPLLAVSPIRTMQPNQDILRKKFSVLHQELVSKNTSENELNEISGRLERGSAIAQQLLNLNEPLPLSTQESCLDLIWFLMASGYQETSDIFHRGVIRLSPLSEAQSKRFKEFFNANPKSYNRISSHFKEATIGHQKGLDFPKGSLPLDPQLGTTLCGRLKDGTFFLKMEREGLRISKPISAAKHMINWIKHVQSGNGHQVIGNRLTRRETDGRSDISPHYQKVLNVWNSISKTNLIPRDKTTKDLPIYQMHQTIVEIKQEFYENDSYYSHESSEDLHSSISSFESSLSDISSPHIAFGRECLLNLEYYL